MKIHLISNMYPSRKYPSYGTFVKKVYEQISYSSDANISKTVLYKEKNGLKRKIMYFIFYLKIFFKLLFNNYEIVYGHYVSHFSIPILLVMRIKKIKLIVNVHGSDITSTKPKDVKLEKYMYKVLLKSDKIIVPSEFMKEVVLDKYPINSNKIYVYPSGGVDETIFYPRENRSNKKDFCDKYQINSENKIISYISRIDSGKGWDTTTKALAALMNSSLFEGWEILFVGSGEQENKLSELLKKNNLGNVIQIPALGREELSDVYNISEWVIFPSELPESLGLVGLESLACGTPVIGTDYAGIASYLINNYNGLLFNRMDSFELSKQIKKAMLMEESEYKIIKENAINSSLKYLSSNIENKLFNILFE